MLSTFAIALAFFISFFCLFETLVFNSVCSVAIAPWIESDLLIINWGLTFDSLSVIMLCVVTGISSLVHLYSSEYMNGDPHQARFMSYLSLFTGFMLFLVTADNFVVMFFGWEGIGLASFLLISFWHTRIQASKSALKAMLVNRVGDIGLALGICVSFLTFKTVNYDVTFALIPVFLNKTIVFFGFDVDVMTIISLLLFWGVLGKSAQIPLHIWLPDAMEGPTPVSALIHAATLVVAGVFLIIRCSALFDNSVTALMVVAIVGSITSFFAASVGLFQNDLKRVIAYSTCSQLGYMIFISGLSHYSVSLFHLANHAVFKALLFLSAGCIIHGLSDEQDLRKMGGLGNIFPVSYVMILIGSLALIGTPFLTGFYSKDCILEIAIAKQSFVGNFSYFLGCSAAFCTAFYSFRLVFLTFVNKTNTFKSYIQTAHEAPIKMIIPLMILSIGAIVHGFLTRDIVIGLGCLLFNNIFINYDNFILIDSEFLPAFIKNIPLLFTICGIVLSLFLINCFNVNKDFVLHLKLAWIPRHIYIFLNKKWHWDQLTNELIVMKTMNFGYNVSFLSIDKGFIEQFGPTGFANKFFHLSFNFSKLQGGSLFHTIFLIIMFVILVLSYYFFNVFCVFSVLNFQFFLLFFCFLLFFLLKY